MESGRKFSLLCCYIKILLKGIKLRIHNIKAKAVWKFGSDAWVLKR
jgi:hypothetical protein